MKVVYKNWEKDQGLEEIQAKIYTEVSDLPAAADEIRERNIRRGPQMTRYILTEKGEPLAYITSNISEDEPWEALIGFPWALPECPSEAQEKIFNEQLEYLKGKEAISKIITAIVLRSKIADKQFEYFKRKGFIEDEHIYQYNQDFDVVEVSKWELEGAANQLTNQLATNDDLPFFHEICKADTELRNAFPDEEAMRNYFEGRVLKDGHAILIFDGNKVVAASAPLRFKPDGIRLLGDREVTIMRFTAIRPEYMYAWKKLMVEIAKECVRAGWTDLPLRIRTNFTSDSPVALAISSINSELTAFEAILKLEIKH